MHRSIRSTLALALAMAALAAAAVAHAAGGVTVELTANRVTKSQGREVLAPAEQARPGDLLEYRALYKNGGKSEARGLSRACRRVSAGAALTSAHRVSREPRLRSQAALGDGR